MATGAKTIKVLTSYKQYELKLVKVAIRRHNIKALANNVQPLVRDVDDPLTISALVHTSGTEYGKLFRKVIPNTIQLPPEAYPKHKSSTGEPKAAPPQAQEAGPSRQRSASCSSDEDAKQERRNKPPRENCRSRSPRRSKSPSVEKYSANEAAPVAKQKRRSPERDRDRERSHSRVPSGGSAQEPADESPEGRIEKRKRMRSPSRSPPQKHARRRHSPSNSPPRRSKSSPAPPGKECVRNLSTRRGIFVPDKGERSSRVRDRSPDSKSPSPTGFRGRRLSRRRSRDGSRERHRRSSRSPSRDRHRSANSRDRDRDRRRKSRSTSWERRMDDRHGAEFAEGVELLSRAHYFDPMIRATTALQQQFYPPLHPFFPATVPTPFFNRPFFQSDVRFPGYRPRALMPVYNNQKKYTIVQQQTTHRSIETSNGNGTPPNQSQENPAAIGKAM